MQSHRSTLILRALGALLLTFFLTLTPAGATTNSAFVQQAYQDLLLRPASPSDLSTFVPQLDNSTLTRTQFALDVMNSDEYRHVRTNEFFNDYLSRSPSPSDYLFLNSVLQSSTLATGRADILGSAEYFSSQGGSNNATFLNSLYLDLLARPIDSTSSTFYQNQLTGGETRSDVALAVQNSDEWRGDIVNDYYQQFLHRPADPTGLAGFKSLLSSGGTEQDVIASLIGSQEYFNNVPEPAAAMLLLAFFPIATTRRR